MSARRTLAALAALAVGAAPAAAQKPPANPQAKYRAQLATRIGGDEKMYYTLTLVKTRTDTSGVGVAAAAFFFDVLLFPVTIAHGGFSRHVPAPTVTQSHEVEVVVVKGKEKAADVIAAFAADALGPNPPADGMARNWGLAKRTFFRNEAVQAAKAIEDKLARAAKGGATVTVTRGPDPPAEK